MTIKLNDLLKIEDLSNVKIRLNIASGDYDPMRLYRESKEELLLSQFCNSSKIKRFKEGEIVIGLARIGNDKWLLFDISRITKDKNTLWTKDLTDVNQFTFYDHEPIKEYVNLFGRVVVNFHKDGSYSALYAGNQINDERNGEHLRIDEFDIFEILPETIDMVDGFPGYRSVSISYSDLKNKLAKSKEWQVALKCRKGVYVISDKETGKLYVGSAYGKDGIYGRWKVYVESGFDKNEMENGRYPNKRLQEIVSDQTKGMNYIQKNFQYSLLETFVDDVDDEYVIRRESYWKNVLLSRKFGYNEN